MLQLPDPGARIVVAGNGPAGTAIALRLTRLGHDVVLIGDQAATRRNEVETVGPGVGDLLRHLGLEAALDYGTIGRAEFEIAWGDSGFQPRESLRPSRLIDRHRFDRALSDLAVAQGVRGLTARVHSASRGPDGWEILIAGPRGRHVVKAGFLVDATGRRGRLLPRQRERGRRLLGLYGTLQGTRLPDHVRIASSADFWVWSAYSGRSRPPIPG